METSFQTIEKDYLAIEPFDVEALDRFYNDYRQYFDKGLPEDKAEQLRYLSMLCEVGMSFSLSERHEEALEILNAVVRYFIHLKLDTYSNPEFNQTLFWLATSNLALKNYASALRYFELYEPNDSNNKADIDLLILVCKDKVFNQRLLAFAIIGSLVFITKYIIKWFFPGSYTTSIALAGLLGPISFLIYWIFVRKTKNENESV